MDDNQNIWEIQRQQYHQWEIQYRRYQWEIDRHQRYTLLLALNVNQVLITSTLLKPTRTKEPYHMSVLTGEGWLLELMAEHPERIHCELGVRLHVFTKLLAQLRRLGHTNTRAVSLEEQVAIFLYTCITGLTTRHVGERFQRSTSTISR